MIFTRDSAFGRYGFGITAFFGLLLICPRAFAGIPECEAHAVQAREAIPAERIANWEPVGDRALLVWTKHDRRAHLVELDRGIPGLLDAPILYLTTRDHDPNVCACGHDGVVVPGTGTARIISIRYLSEKRTAELDSGGTGPPRMEMTFT